MKIIMDYGDTLDVAAGGTVHIIEVLRSLKKRNNVSCFVRKSENIKYKWQEIVYVPLLDKRFFRALSSQLVLFLYLFYYCIKIKPDIIYARQAGLTFSPVIMSKLFRIPYAVEINGLIIEEIKISNASKSPVLSIYLAKLSEKLNYKHAQKIVAVTQGVKEGIKKLYNIPDEKIVVIENGANTELFKPIDSQKARTELNIDESYNYVGFSGSFAPWHGLENLVKSAPLIIKEVGNTKFLLVGAGRLLEHIIQRVNDLNLTDNFIFINKVPYEEVPKYVNAFDVCVILKKKNISGSPLKLWEYMACGKPVIATNTQDFKALEEYNAGTLVDPEKPEEVADAIIALLKNKKLREEMGKNGRKYVVENRSWESVARRVEEVCKSVIIKHKNKRR
jgi:glycosyltransferase involved in cell wall biosynthesis